MRHILILLKSMLVFFFYGSLGVFSILLPVAAILANRPNNSFTFYQTIDFMCNPTYGVNILIPVFIGIGLFCGITVFFDLRKAAGLKNPEKLFIILSYVVAVFIVILVNIILYVYMDNPDNKTSFQAVFFMGLLEGVCSIFALGGAAYISQFMPKTWFIRVNGW